jgi:hypothetical protein
MKSTQLTTFLQSLKLGLSFVEDLPAELDGNYKTIKIRSRRRHGKMRVLRLPDEDLKWIQSRILKDWLAPKFSFSSCVQGGVKGRSARTNAVAEACCTCMNLKNSVAPTLSQFQYKYQRSLQDENQH